MNKKEIRIEALSIVWGLCTSVDICMWNEEDPISYEDRNKVLMEIYRIGVVQKNTAERLERSNKTKNEKGQRKEML